MYIPSAPMDAHTVQFAKDHRAEQIRYADQSRVAAQFRTRRNLAGGRRRPWTSTMAHLRLRQVTTDPALTARALQ